MKITFQVGDILQSGCEAIVNSANPSLLAGSGLSGAIHRAAGQMMEGYLKKFSPLLEGNAVSSPAYGINADYVIHTVATRCIHNNEDEFSKLVMAYEAAINLAEALEVRSVAFPAIGIGIYKWHPIRSAEAFYKAIAHISHTNQLNYLQEIQFHFLDNSLVDVFIQERDAWFNYLSEQILKKSGPVFKTDYSIFFDLMIQPQKKETFTATEVLAKFFSESYTYKAMSISHINFVYPVLRQLCEWGIDFTLDIDEESLDYSNSNLTYNSLINLFSCPPQINYDWVTLDLCIDIARDDESEYEKALEEHEFTFSSPGFLPYLIYLIKDTKHVKGIRCFDYFTNPKLKEYLAARWKFAHENFPRLKDK